MRAPLSYIGGKFKLADTIISLIPEHTTYCEVFSGAAWVFFKKEPSKNEVINDRDSDLISFYRVVQAHPEEFLRQFKYCLSSREVFEDWQKQLESGGLTDIQRAARYYYIQRLCFGGRVRGRTFGVAVDRAPRINLARFEEQISDVHFRLSRVVIENLDWREFLKRYDRPETFFYLDPPYYKKPYYTHNLAHDDYVEMADILRGLNGKWILSIDGSDEIREIFKGFRQRKVVVQYSAGIASTKKAMDGQELIITRD